MQRQRVFVSACPQYPDPYYRTDPRTGMRTLLADFELEIGGAVISIPAGWQWDGASVPRIAWTFISKEDLGELPAMGHDYLSRCGGCPPVHACHPYMTWTRAEADALFYWAMLDAGVVEWRARAAYTTVRVVGGRHWKG